MRECETNTFFWGCGLNPSLYGNWDICKKEVKLQYIAFTHCKRSILVPRRSACEQKDWPAHTAWTPRAGKLERLAPVRWVGLARTIYIRCIYGVFGREITKYTVIYGVHIRFWPTLQMRCAVLKTAENRSSCNHHAERGAALFCCFVIANPRSATLFCCFVLLLC